MNYLEKVVNSNLDKFFIILQKIGFGFYAK